VLKQPDVIAIVEDALADLQTSLAGDFADPDLALADERLAGGQRAFAGADEALAVIESENTKARRWPDAANDRAARQREAERLDQALKNAFHGIEQLRASLDNFIAAIAPLGPAGAEAAAAAADYRETMRESAARTLDRGAQRKREILANIKAVPEPAAGAELAQRRIFRLQR